MNTRLSWCRPTITASSEMCRKDGEVFPAGTQFEVLRVDDETVNLCEMLPGVPGGPCGRTICGVQLKPEDMEKIRKLA